MLAHTRSHSSKLSLSFHCTFSSRRESQSQRSPKKRISNALLPHTEKRQEAIVNDGNNSVLSNKGIGHEENHESNAVQGIFSVLCGKIVMVL